MLRLNTEAQAFVFKFLVDVAFALFLSEWISSYIEFYIKWCKLVMRVKWGEWIFHKSVW